jgi:hypothetical protein
MPKGRRLAVWIAVAVVAVAAAAAVLFVLFPSGSDTAVDAALAEVRSREEATDAAVLAERPWGDGTLVLVGFGSRADRKLALVFAVERSRGYRAASYTAERADTSDVKVGSLLLATSEGGSGQPAWSAAYGELADERIVKVEIRWRDEQKTSAERQGGAYLVVREAQVEASEARYLDKDGTEIAAVPVPDA